METLRFINPEFHAGINYTVRLGDRWAQLATVGDFVEVEGFNGVGRVRDIFTCKLNKVPDTVLEKEHDGTCSTFTGLTEAMMLAYPELGEMTVDEVGNQTVTCIGFWLYSLWTDLY